jgi:hypothetical protein
MAKRPTPAQRAHDKAQTLNDDNATSRQRGPAITLDAKSILSGAQTGVEFPARTRGTTSVNAGVLTELRKLVHGGKVGDTYRLNAPADEKEQTALATLVRRAVDQECGYDMGTNVAVKDGFMFIELKRRKARKASAA